MFTVHYFCHFSFVTSNSLLFRGHFRLPLVRKQYSTVLCFVFVQSGVHFLFLHGTLFGFIDTVTLLPTY